MKVRRTRTAIDSFSAATASSWSGLTGENVTLFPSPVGMAVAVSPHMATRVDHGKVGALDARAVHDGETLSIRLAWSDPTRDDEMVDLDRFVDAAAVMFPLGDDAEPLTMGDEARPVNAWLWKADQSEPYDVLARGYSTSERRAASLSGLSVSASYEDGVWAVVFQRPLGVAGGAHSVFRPGSTAKISFAVWDGNNAERAGQKAVSGPFREMELEG